MLDTAYIPEVGRTNQIWSTGSNLFGWGEVTSAVPEALRLVGKPATSADVAAAMMVKKDVRPVDNAQAELLGKVTGVFIAKAAPI